MGFFQDIKNRYGRNMMNYMKEFSNNNVKLAKLKNRRIFLLQCKKQGICPRHILNNLKNIEYQFEYKDSKSGHRIISFINKFGFKIMNMEIDLTHKNLIYLEKRQDSLKNEIQKDLPEIIWLDYSHRLLIKFNKIFHIIKNKNIKKLEKLKKEQKFTIITQDSWLKNLSNNELPESVKTILSLGPKFCIQPNTRDIKIPNLLSEINGIVSKIDDKKNRDVLTAKFTNIITNFTQKETVQSSELEKLYRTTGKFLKEHPELIVVQSDKGNVTTVMNREQYDILAERQLGNEENYTKLTNDPSSNIQQKANRIVSELKKKKLINSELASKLMFYRGNASQFYGLPKIHKEILDLRPIIASIESPNSKLAEFAKEVLTKSYDFNNEFYVSDSFQFSEFINNRIIPEDYVLVSWDIVSLFTNISFELAELCINENWDTIQENSPLNRNEFIKIIKFIFETTIFSFKGVYYKQKYGTPMGSTLSPIIAQFVVDLVLKNCLKKLPFKVPFIKKFMDDILTAVPKNSVEESLQIINQIHDKIQFTLEKETNGSIPFLDVLVIREGNILITDWYRKPMSSGRYIHWQSYQPITQKINMIRNLKSRILSISHSKFKSKNLKLLEEILRKNGYPKKWLNKILFNIPNNNSVLQEPQEFIEEELKNFLVLPFHEKLTNRLRELIPREKFKLAIRNVKPIRKIFTKLKDKIENFNRSNVIYKIHCNDCEKCYIGQTSTKLKQRISQHKSNIRTQKETCALSIHSLEEQHQPNFSDVIILDSEKDSKKRSFLEMLRISQNENCMNSRKDICGLSSIFSYLIHFDSINHRI